MAMTDTSRLFVSYATPDKDLAYAITDLLQLGCDLADGQIFSTARPGTIEAGTLFVETIRDALVDSAMALCVLTPGYFESEFCLAELGGVWANDLRHVPLVVPPVTFAELDGVQLGRQGLRLDRESDLDTLRDQIAEVFGRLIPTARWSSRRDDFLARWETELKTTVSARTKVPAEELARACADAATNAEELEEAKRVNERLVNYAQRLKADNERLREGGETSVPPPEPLDGDETAQAIAEAIAAIERAQIVMEDVPVIVRDALFRHFQNKRPLTLGGEADEWSTADARAAIDDGWLDPEPDESAAVWPRFDKPELETVKAALTDVRNRVFDGDTFSTSATAGTWIRPVLKERYGVDDPKFELRPTWVALGLL
jgi:hypothetical protein